MVQKLCHCASYCTRYCTRNFVIVPDTAVPDTVPEVVLLYTEGVLLFAPDIAPEDV